MSDLTQGPVLRRVIGFAIPLTVANLVQQSYLLVDGIVVGWYLDVGGLAAVGVSQPLVYLAYAVFLGVATGFSIRLAQVTGARQDRQLSGAAIGLAVVTVAWSLACVALVFLFARPLLALMGLSGQLADDSYEFLAVISLGFVPMFAVGALCAFLRGLGNSTVPMYLLGFSSVLNMVLAWLFVGPLGYGLRGAAAATVLASTATLVVGIWYARRTTVVRISWTDTEHTRSELRRAAGLGLPVATQHVLLALGIMVLIWIISPLGSSFIAAMTVVGRLEMFTAMVFLDFSGALTVFVAQNLGAGQAERIRHGVRQVVGLAGVLTLLVSAAVMLLAPQIATVFTDDPAARETIVRYIMITYPFFFLYTVMAVMHGYLNGTGRTVLPLVCTIISFLVVRLPLSYVLREPYGADGVIWMVNIGWLAGFIFTVVVTAQRMSVGRAAVPEVAAAVR